jgi:hypothetical protein
MHQQQEPSLDEHDEFSGFFPYTVMLRMASFPFLNSTISSADK